MNFLLHSSWRPVIVVLDNPRIDSFKWQLAAQLSDYWIFYAEMAHQQQYREFLSKTDYMTLAFFELIFSCRLILET